MATENLITRESVAIAAQKITEGGRLPSVRSVMALLGGGSPNTVLPFLNEWKASRASAQTPDIPLDPGIAQLISRQIAQAATVAAASAEAKVAEMQSDAELIAEAGRAAELLVERLQAELEQARAQIQQQTGQLEERGREIEKSRSDATEQVAAAVAMAERERQAAESVRQDLVRALIRVEAVPRLEAEVTALAGQIREAESALAQALQVEAVAVARLESQSARADESVVRENLALEQNRRLEKELAESRALERAGLERAQQLERELGQAQAKIAATNAGVAGPT